MSDPTPRTAPPARVRPEEPRLPEDVAKRAKRPPRRRTGRALVLAAIFALIVPAVVLAQGSYVTTWSSTYPLSSSDNASCELCHGDGDTGLLNSYGLAIHNAAGATIAARITSVAGANSDADPAALSNLAEINANSQPGWTVGTNNTLYDVAPAPLSRGLCFRRPASPG